MLEFDIKSAHRMVNQQKALGNDVRWDGWDIVFFRPADHGIHNVDGAFRNGVWGFDNRVIVNSEGKWRVDPRNIKRPRRAGNRPRRG
jgi:hypothetical protein